MADKLTEEELTLIEEAIARGVLQVIPKGVSGMPEQPLSWRQSVDRSYANLKRADKLKSLLFKRSPQSDAVEAVIRKMVDDGKTNAQISAATKLTSGAVAQRISRMGIVRSKRKAGTNVPFGE